MSVVLDPRLQGPKFCNSGNLLNADPGCHSLILLLCPGPPSVLDLFASMTPSTSMKFEELGKQLCTSGWFLGSFCVRSLAALIVLALMMLIAAIWVRCGLAFVGLGPPLDDAMLFGCSWGSFSIFVVVQLLPGVSSCVCEPDGCLHFCFPGSSGAFDTMMDLVGLFICSCVCGCLHALDMQVPVSSGAFEFSYVLALFYSQRQPRWTILMRSFGMRLLHLDCESGLL